MQALLGYVTHKVPCFQSTTECLHLDDVHGYLAPSWCLLAPACTDKLNLWVKLCQNILCCKRAAIRPRSLTSRPWATSWDSAWCHEDVKVQHVVKADKGIVERHPGKVRRSLAMSGLCAKL